MQVIRLPARLVAVAIVMAGSSHALATAVTYTVDPARSSLTLSGSWLGQPLNSQGRGSLTTSYTGTIEADLGETAIQFTSAALDANTNGDYRLGVAGVPGVMAADYGGTFRLRPGQPLAGRLEAAFRDVSAGLGSEPLTLTNDTFDAGGLFGNIGGALDYIGRGSPTPVEGGRAIIDVSDAANGAGVGTLSTIDKFEWIEIPVELTFTADLNSPIPAAYREVLLTLSGNIVASRELSVPEPAAVALLAVGGLSLLRRRRRRT